MTHIQANIKTAAARLAVLYQVSTYKVLTIGPSRPTPVICSGKGSLQQHIRSVPALMSHADTSATAEPDVLDDAMHLLTANAENEMQTWMLLEVSIYLFKVELLLLHASLQQ